VSRCVCNGQARGGESLGTIAGFAFSSLFVSVCRQVRSARRPALNNGLALAEDSASRLRHGTLGAGEAGVLCPRGSGAKGAG